jgi:hypothetical protein
MWCIGALTAQYRQRMYDLLALYARPFRSREPVVCVDEKSKQLLRDTRAPLPGQPGAPAKHDYEYARAGTCNLFVAVEPKGGRRTVAVTDRRAKIDFVAFVKYLLEHVYANARRIHLVLDNLSTHFRVCFEAVLGIRAAPHFSSCNAVVVSVRGTHLDGWQMGGDDRVMDATGTCPRLRSWTQQHDRSLGMRTAAGISAIR